MIQADCNRGTGVEATTYRDSIRAKLVPERGEEIQELEGLDTRPRLRQGLIMERRNDEADEIHHEPNTLHPLTSIKLMVNEPRSSVISSERTSDIDQVVQPTSHNTRSWLDNLDELRLENLVSVEEKIIAEPTSGRCDQAGPVV